MFHESPMVNFNKNNPFIMIAKRRYDHILDDIQIFGADCIRFTIINSIINIIDIGLGIVLIWYNIKYFIPMVVYLVANILLNILGIILFRRKAKYFMSSHPQMQNFDKISSMEVNVILTMNNEDILKCVNGLYELHGELTATRKYYKSMLVLHGVMEIIICILYTLTLLI